jgi:hypothetical protein
MAFQLLVERERRVLRRLEVARERVSCDLLVVRVEVRRRTDRILDCELELESLSVDRSPLARAGRAPDVELTGPVVDHHERSRCASDQTDHLRVYPARDRSAAGGCDEFGDRVCRAERLAVAEVDPAGGEPVGRL